MGGGGEQRCGQTVGVRAGDRGDGSAGGRGEGAGGVLTCLSRGLPLN